ncbi:ceramidase domain-containing protein [Dactylosporangium sp. NPDC051541]|uniref:ceramidase domain-containing protein n=1 Tax=Dactylosporangium sp. NPDC051541 TaxID=3363977 RepID=UPI0037B86D45
MEDRAHRRTARIAAGATAVLSCGLLALAIARGWLGPDVGRGGNFCEAARPGLIRQPANTFSNLGFVIAGLLIAWRTVPTPVKAPMAGIVVLLGPASAAMHATQSAAGGALDMLSMYLIAAFAVSYAVMRWFGQGYALFAGVFVGCVAGCALAGLYTAPIPVVMYAGNVAFGVLLITAVALEVAIIRRRRTTSRPLYAYASIAAMLLAFAIWNVTNHGLCAPHSLLQGHAVWHLLSAVAAYLLYRYYESEVNTNPVTRPEH